MKEFVSEAKCEKCGFVSRPLIEYKTGIFDIEFQQSLSSQTLGLQITPKYLLRTCRQCGYKWPERTIDS